MFAVRRASASALFQAARGAAPLPPAAAALLPAALGGRCRVLGLGGVRYFGDSHGGLGSLLKEVERQISTGMKMDVGGELYTSIQGKVAGLRAENDMIMQQATELTKAREADVALEDQLLKSCRDGGNPDDLKKLLEVSARIQAFDGRIAGLRVQQLEQSKDVAALKRGMARIETVANDQRLLEEIGPVLEKGTPAELAAARERLHKLDTELLDRFDGHSTVVQAVKKEIDLAVNKLRNLVLALRIRRGTIDAEVESLRGLLVSSFYAAQRKNARLTRLRNMQADCGKEIAFLEQELYKLATCERVRTTIQERNPQLIQAEMRRLSQEAEATREAVLVLEKQRLETAEEGKQMVARLRAPENINTVSPQTAEMREDLVRTLREEEIAAQRLSALRGTQASQLKLLAELKAAS